MNTRSFTCFLLFCLKTKVISVSGESCYKDLYQFHTPFVIVWSKSTRQNITKMGWKFFKVKVTINGEGNGNGEVKGTKDYSYKLFYGWHLTNHFLGKLFVLMETQELESRTKMDSYFCPQVLSPINYFQTRTTNHWKVFLQNIYNNLNPVAAWRSPNLSFRVLFKIHS